MLNVPNSLTILRLIMLPLIIACFFYEDVMGAQIIWVALGLYTLAAITDFLDGYLARKLNQITAFGTFLDPISDKIFVTSLLITLLAFDRLPGLWILVVLVILGREFLVSGLREYLGPHKITLPVTQLAKWKTAVQMIAVGALIIGPYLPYGLEAGQWGLAIAAALTLVTGWGYLKAGLDHMSKMS